jgi:glycosyltransferase involved in cell wall biosynthesis
MRIALVHDYFTQLGGAEKVVEALYRMLPQAIVFATITDPNRIPPALEGVDIQTSCMQRLPAIDRFYRHYFPLYPIGVATLDLSGFDLVISSSSGYAKGVRVDPNAIHICYCHTPMRWVWRHRDYASRERFGAGQRFLMRLVLGGLRAWDEHAARQPDQFVVNSSAVAERVREAYGRYAVVIPPPIDVHRFSISPVQDDYYLVLSRLVGYKRIDLAVQACTRSGKKLVVIGDGPDRVRLQNMAGPTVEFLGRAPDAVVEKFASRCRALIFPGEEDFGMVPLEVNAAGRPVIAFKAGGALDTIIEGVNGLFFEGDRVDSLCETLEHFETCAWDSRRIRRHAEQFDVKMFEQRFIDLLRSVHIHDLPFVEERSLVASA